MRSYLGIVSVQLIAVAMACHTSTNYRYHWQGFSRSVTTAFGDAHILSLPPLSRYMCKDCACGNECERWKSKTFSTNFQINPVEVFLKILACVWRLRNKRYHFASPLLTNALTVSNMSLSSFSCRVFGLQNILRCLSLEVSGYFSSLIAVFALPELEKNNKKFLCVLNLISLVACLPWRQNFVGN